MELGPKTITIGTVLFWNWGFWDYRPDSVILRSESDISIFLTLNFADFSKELGPREVARGGAVGP